MVGRETGQWERTDKDADARSIVAEKSLRQNLEEPYGGSGW